MNTQITTNRCRILRPLVLAALLAFASFSNLAATSKAAPTNPTCQSNCATELSKIGLGGLAAVLSPALCGSNNCKNDCKAAGIPILTCNQICIAV